LLTVAFAVCFFATVASAQTNTGEITGTVRDSQGGVLPDATVIAEHLETRRAANVRLTTRDDFTCARSRWAPCRAQVVGLATLYKRTGAEAEWAPSACRLSPSRNDQKIVNGFASVLSVSFTSATAVPSSADAMMKYAPGGFPPGIVTDIVSE
jgi:hypothetical protein